MSRFKARQRQHRIVQTYVNKFVRETLVQGSKIKDDDIGQVQLFSDRLNERQPCCTLLYKIQPKGTKRHINFVLRASFVPTSTAQDANNDIVCQRALTTHAIQRQNPHIVMMIDSFAVPEQRIGPLLWKARIASTAASATAATAKRTPSARGPPPTSKFFRNLYESWSGAARHGDRTAYISVTEYCSLGSLFAYANRKRAPAKSEQWWRVVIAQVILCLDWITDEYPYWRHNDLHCSNVLLVKTVQGVGKHTNYERFGTRITLPSVGCEVRLSDFEYANMQQPLDKEGRFGVGGLSKQYYDIHTFCNSLLNESKQLQLPPAIIQLLHSIVPAQYRIPNDKTHFGRLSHDATEFVTPRSLVQHHPLFRPFYTHISVPASPRSLPQPPQAPRAQTHDPTTTTSSDDKVMTYVQSSPWLQWALLSFAAIPSDNDAHDTATSVLDPLFVCAR